ncbi:MAG: hypothetical protein MPW15_10190 [Candidatus Manganitrophus sp.]|nr:hypothetical protein [Candidatus Manganitrophus sp.]
MKFYTDIDSPLGPILLVSDGMALAHRLLFRLLFHRPEVCPG